MEDMVIFALMIAGGIVFIGGITLVLLLLVFLDLKDSQRAAQAKS